MSNNSSSFQVFTELLSKNFKNASENGLGGEVLIKRKNNLTNSLQDASEAELNVLSTKSRLAETAQMLKGLPSEEKLSWAITAKDNANSLFKAGNFSDAMAIYVDCLAASDFGTQSVNSGVANIDELVIPVVCNLAACSIQMKEWKKAASFCDQALDLRPRCLKALFRKGIALLEIYEYEASIASFELCCQLQSQEQESSDGAGAGVCMPLSEQERARIPKLLLRARNGIRRQKEHFKKQQLALVRAFDAGSSHSSSSGSSSSSTAEYDRSSSVIQHQPALRSNGKGEDQLPLMSAWELLCYFCSCLMAFLWRLLPSKERST